MSLGVSFETYLRRHCNVQKDVAATSPRRFNAGWEFCKKSELFGLPFCYWILKVSRTQSLCHWISMHSAWFTSTFLRVLKFLQIKEGWPNLWGEPILQKAWFIWPLLYFNCKSCKDEIPSSFIRFQYILDDSEERLSDILNFYKLKSGDLIFGENQFCRKSEWFGCPFCISILNLSKTKIFCYSLAFNNFLYGSEEPL